MRRDTSIYLDLLRAGAAVSVFLMHTRNFLLPEMTGARWGNEAVSVFFVLSGYVISYVMENRQATWQSFASARFSRIYPVAVIAILATWVADSIGWSWDHAYFLEMTQRFFSRSTAGFDWVAAARYLTFTNQLWWSHVIWGTNEPYWTLGFEIPYYVLAGLAAYLSGAKRIFWLVVWCAVCGPALALFVPLWLVGVATQRVVKREWVRSKVVALVLVVAAWELFRGVVAWGLADGVRAIYVNPTVKVAMANFFYFTAIGVVVGVSIVAADCWCGAKRVCPEWMEKAIRWVAGGSFTLYLVHQSLAILMSVFFRVGRDGFEARVVGVVLVFVLAMLIAEIGERRNGFYNQLTKRMLGA